jgi:hypothetical protein
MANWALPGGAAEPDWGGGIMPETGVITGVEAGSGGGVAVEVGAAGSGVGVGGVEAEAEAEAGSAGGGAWASAEAMKKPQFSQNLPTSWSGAEQLGQVMVIGVSGGVVRDG